MTGLHTHYCVYGSTVRLIGFCWSAKTSQEVNQQSTASKRRKKKKSLLVSKSGPLTPPSPQHPVKSLGFTCVGVSITGFSLCLIDVKKEVCLNVSIMDKLNLTAVSTASKDLLHTTLLIAQQLAFDLTPKHSQIYKCHMTSTYLNNQFSTTSSSIKSHAAHQKPGLERRAAYKRHVRNKRKCHHVEMSEGGWWCIV